MQAYSSERDRCNQEQTYTAFSSKFLSGKSAHHSSRFNFKQFVKITNFGRSKPTRSVISRLIYIRLLTSYCKFSNNKCQPKDLSLLWKGLKDINVHKCVQCRIMSAGEHLVKKEFSTLFAKNYGKLLKCASNFGDPQNCDRLP